MARTGAPRRGATRRNRVCPKYVGLQVRSHVGHPNRGDMSECVMSASKKIAYHSVENWFAVPLPASCRDQAV